MSNHRIHIIAALSAIALCAAPSLTAQTNTGTRSQGQEPSSSTSSSNAGPTSGQAGSATSTSSSDSSQRTASGSGQSSSGWMASGEVKRATDDADQSTVAQLKGKRLRSSDGNELGKVHDFIVDGASGKIVHVVVSTGGMLGLGDKLRLVSPAGVKQSAEGFTTDMQKSDFQALPTITSKEINAGNFTAQAGSSQQDISSVASTAASHSTGQLIRASQLKDKSIRSDDREVGEIENVVVDLQSGTVMALIDAKESFAGQSGDFLVPFSKLEIRSADADSITTSLLRSDFPEQGSALVATTSSSPSTSGASTSTRPPDTITNDPTPAPASSTGASQVASSSSPSRSTAPDANQSPGTADKVIAATGVVTTIPSPQPTDEQLTPTGRSSADQSPASAGSAMAIRHALDADPTLAREDVTVKTKIVLEGSVQSEEAKKRVEEIVKQNATAAEIDNRITVQKK